MSVAYRIVLLQMLCIPTDERTRLQSYERADLIRSQSPSRRGRGVGVVLWTFNAEEVVSGSRLVAR